MVVRDLLFMLLLLVLVLILLLGLAVQFCNTIPLPRSWVERGNLFAATVECVFAG
ncbi:hypothetical protein RchiOBHm_Chr4g0431721 [Rosa chinensis]|uniref:Uncharacterized protein n=1 Tax=Rosa chinensis TaxID=74649 RepID=A0A2P6R0U7_ROSCH|nr:hypothetical protein RchiOBHm_Chr4g0431721 [Rosa chinensis]